MFACVEALKTEVHRGLCARASLFETNCSEPDPRLNYGHEIPMKIGFIGLGMMGARMAANLIKHGHSLIVNDMLHANAQSLIALGAQWAATPAALGTQVDVVFLSLPGPPQVQEVLTGPNGLTAGLRAGSAVFDFSTNSPRVIRELHAELAKKELSNNKDISLISTENSKKNKKIINLQKKNKCNEFIISYCRR